MKKILSIIILGLFISNNLSTTINAQILKPAKDFSTITECIDKLGVQSCCNDTIKFLHQQECLTKSNCIEKLECLNSGGDISSDGATCTNPTKPICNSCSSTISEYEQIETNLKNKKYQVCYDDAYSSLDVCKEYNKLNTNLKTLKSEYKKCIEENAETPINSIVGIQCNPELMELGQCKFNVYDTLGIRKSDKDASVGIFVQDIILSSTMFIGTIVVIAMIISGLMFVFAGANSSLKEKAMKGLINAFIGLLLVLSSYTIIRLVQFIIKGD